MSENEVIILGYEEIGVLDRGGGLAYWNARGEWY